MSRIYDVVCCNCGEIMSWCKYDSPIEICENCGTILSHGEDWTDDAKIFGIGSSEEPERFSKPIRERYYKRHDGAFQNPSFRVGKI
jgi:hypothetical protein